MIKYVSLILAVVAVLESASSRGQASAPASQSGGIDLFVALEGGDRNPGTIDKPFATLERARDEVRKLKKDGKLTAPVTVNVRAATYYLDRTFKLSAQDSGSAEAPITYRGYGKERPVLVGGRVIKDFAQHKDKILVADLASQGFKDAKFRQLFFDGWRQVLARYPNFDAENPCSGGWAYADGKEVDMYRDLPGESRRVLQFRQQDSRAWARPTDGEVFVFARYNWWNNIVRIASIDSDKRTATLAADCSYAIRPGDRYYVQGLLEELDAPGEWHLDQQAGKLYFWPPGPLEGKAVVAPMLRTIIELGDNASHVTIQGFDIQCCEGTAVTLTNATDCLIAACKISHVGDYNGKGVQIYGGLRNGIVGCDISHTGHDGIEIGSGDRTTLQQAGNYADNNYVHHVGVFYKQGVGVQLNGSGNRASRNLIHDCPRMGILFSGNNLLIEYNHIRHVNLETEDTGVVYSGGRDWISSRGTVIRYNYFHDSLGFGRKDGKWVSPYFAWGVYLDDNCGGVDVIGNIIARCSRAGLHLHNGRDNHVQNNVFIDNGVYQAEYSGWTESSSYWKDHFPRMVKGYESVASQPAWKGMRGMKTHPKDAILPDGLIMSGNVLSTNIFYYRGTSAGLYRFANVAFDHNEADRNVVWHAGLPITTGQAKGGKTISANLLANPSFEDGPAGEMPKGWIWQARPSTDCKAIGDATAADGKRSLRIDGVKVKDAKCNPPWPVIVSADDIPAVPGHTYKLTAKLKAAKADTPVRLAAQSYVANAYYWGRATPAMLSTDWKEYEVVFRLPAKGEAEYHEKMKAVRPRLDLPGSEGTVWMDDVKLVEVEALDEWQSLQACGFDKNSLVADPLFVDPAKDDWRLKAESPALKLGFKPIPIDKIGPYADPLRASWPIIEAKGTRERMATTASQPK